MLKNPAEMASLVRDALAACNGQISPEVKDAFVAFSMARALSLALPMPSTCVDSISGYYTSTHAATADEVISAMNEQYVLDVVTLRDLTFKLYKLRYQLVFEPRAVSDLFAGFASFSDGAVAKNILEVERQYGTADCRRLVDTLVWGFSTALGGGNKGETLAGAGA